MFRVDYEELNPSFDFLLMEYAGKPFSGIAFENNEDGLLISEDSFIEGQKSGVSRKWSDSGNLICEEWLALNSLHGPSFEWYENGLIKIDSLYELGVCLVEKKLDQHGKVVKHYRIDEDGPQFSILKKLRSNEALINSLS